MPSTLITRDRCSGGYRSLSMDIEAGPPPASLMALPARETSSVQKPMAPPPQAASAPPRPRVQARIERRVP